jgi:N-acetylglucosamine-6-phosphate deacetylase
MIPIFEIPMLNHPQNSPHSPLQQSKIKVTRYTHARLLREHQLKEEDLWVSGKKIILPQTKADETIDVKGLIIAPGYIDLQINGAFGCDFTTQPENVLDVAKELPKFGVTSFLPTVVTTNREQYRRCLPLLQPQEGGAHGAHILGIHLEGPFFNVQCAGPTILPSFET